MGYTLAPWTHENDCIMLDPVTRKPVEGQRIYGNEGFMVAEIYHASPEDGRVMKLAPELVEALEALLKNHEGLVNSGDCGKWSVDSEVEVMNAKVLLAKVKGGS